MSRKVTLQVFGTNAPAETRQPAEYIFDVQSVEMVLDIGGSVEWLAAILKNTLRARTTWRPRGCKT